jgi:hypothetical protein
LLKIGIAFTSLDKEAKEKFREFRKIFGPVRLGVFVGWVEAGEPVNIVGS